MSRESPILFNCAMVRAILAGAKAQTRRAIKPQPLEASFLDAQGAYQPRFDEEGRLLVATVNGVNLLTCPFGQPGDRLWVRESFTDLRGTGIEHRPDPSGPIQRYAYSADTLPGSHGDMARKDFGIKWRPSIHMPRDACRLVLEVTDVRVERLQTISEADALAEGIEDLNGRFTFNGGMHESLTPRLSFQTMWTSTGGDWAGNPWVWVVSFMVVTP